jgi:hypothetical protein
MNLALLVYELRAAGVKSLALELLDEPSSPPIADEGRPTLAPDNSEPDVPPKQPDQCIIPGCTAERRGIFGGIGGQYCREHALQRAGVRT